MKENSYNTANGSDDLSDGLVPKFDGATLYEAAFHRILRNHLSLCDKKSQAGFIQEWQKKFPSADLAEEDACEKAIEKMLASLGNSYDQFINVDGMRELTDQQQSSWSGIGIMSAIKTAQSASGKEELIISDSQPLVITEVLAESPAFGKLKVGDIIVSIGSKPVNGMTMAKAVDAMRGFEGSQVSITVKRLVQSKAEEYSFTFSRARIIRKVVSKMDFDGIAYIKLDHFVSQRANFEMQSALKEVRGARGLVLDLRGNFGGDIALAIAIMEHLVPEGLLLVTNRRQDDNMLNVEVSINPTHTVLTEINVTEPGSKPKVARWHRQSLLIAGDVPMVVLVDQDTASAAEVVASVLRRHRKAFVVGKQTYKKGIGQDLIYLPFDRAMLVSTFEFLPHGETMEGIGVVPDQVVDDRDSQLSCALTYINDGFVKPTIAA